MIFSGYTDKEAPQTQAGKDMIIPPHLEDHTFLVHDCSNVADLHKAILMPKAHCKDMTRWRDEIITTGLSRASLAHEHDREFRRENPQGLLTFKLRMTPVFMHGMFWTRLLSADNETLIRLREAFPVTHIPEFMYPT